MPPHEAEDERVVPRRNGRAGKAQEGTVARVSSQDRRQVALLPIPRDIAAAINLLHEACRTTGSSEDAVRLWTEQVNRLMGDGSPALGEAGTKHC